MKKLTNYLILSAVSLTMISCSKNDNNSVANNISLHFNNTFKNNTIVLGGVSNDATVNTSEMGQVHHLSELKYVVSNIRLVKADGTEIPYNVNDLDKGATVVNQAKPASLDYVLTNIPVGEYRQLKFGLGVKQEINTVDQVKFPAFYAAAGANDTDMMWQWATGYRFTKIEGFYGAENNAFKIHTGSTLNGTSGQPETYTQGVDAYRDITLDLTTTALVGNNAPKITIKANLDKLLSGKEKVALTAKNATTPSQHSSMEAMEIFVNNIGGNGKDDKSGMFSVESVENN
ncbi:MbnP family protein [Sphingobacterium sp. HMA12]|uniref:MbnP family protein n=1 Tax=Sphingobacterium sp. HMA12 TaxID=2050894 RepID=UPI000CEA5817|nr:MbnP family protein [Sphingobacterium sp. HMA12]